MSCIYVIAPRGATIAQKRVRDSEPIILIKDVYVFTFFS